MLVESFLETSAGRWPDKTALVCGSRRWTFAQLETMANRLAHGLLAEGVRRGDRVAVYLDHGVEAVVSIFAIMKAAGVLLVVNPTTKPEKLCATLNHSRAAALITSARKAAALGEIWDHMPHLRSVIVDGETALHSSRHRAPCSHGRSAVRPGAPTTPAPCPVPATITLAALMARHAGDVRPPAKRAIDVDLAALIYTSGSTGDPKGVMLTHLNMVSAATSITAYLENTPDDVILSVLPLSFGYGLYQVLMGAKTGGTVVLERSFAYPQAIVRKLIDERVTGFPLVPTMAAILLQMDLAKYDWSHLRYVTTAAAAMPTEHLLQFQRALPHVRIYLMYGQTECTRVTYLAPEELQRRPASVGRGMPNEEVWIADEEGRRVGPGVVGELIVRGANVMRGYWEMPEETARRLRPGPLPGESVLTTGDLFRADDEGYLYFVGRKDDIIKSRGEKVSPLEVENVLCRHPDIAEAAVIGVPDAVLGQAVRAVVSLKSGSRLTEREMLRHCAERLEDFMVPKSVEVRDSLPRTSNGKIDKRELLRSALLTTEQSPPNASRGCGPAAPPPLDAVEGLFGTLANQGSMFYGATT